MNPEPWSAFQNRLPGRAKWCPTAPDHSPGLIPTNTTSSSGPRTSGIVRPRAASSSAFEGLTRSANHVGARRYRRLHGDRDGRSADG